MARPEDEGRTEQATPKRRQKARERGQVLKSREFTTAVILLCGIAGLTICSSLIYQQMSSMLRASLSTVGQSRLNPGQVHKMLINLSQTSALAVGPLMLILTLAAVLANYLQVGRMFSWEVIRPKLPTLNPLTGIKRMVSVRSLVELGKSVVKVLIIGGIAWFTLRGEMDHLLPLMDQEVGQIVIYMLNAAAKVFWRTGLALLILSALDYLYQRYQFENSLKMTKEEVKDERRQAEGDPKVKNKLRAIMLKRMMQRMMSAIPTADVVITNPTHLAVALRYDSVSMAAPQVVAKGRGYVALRIMELADAAGVPRVENKPLAQALFKSVDVDEFIPVTLYKAVAEILAHIYRMRGRRFGAAATS